MKTHKLIESIWFEAATVWAPARGVVMIAHTSGKGMVRLTGCGARYWLQFTPMPSSKACVVSRASFKRLAQHDPA